MAEFDVNTRFTVIVQQLAKRSPYYPELLKERDGDVVYFSTMVRIKREGIWYKIHCVQSYNPTLPSWGKPKVTDADCLTIIMREVYKIQHLYLIDVKRDKVDECQEEETTRLLKLLNDQTR